MMRVIEVNIYRASTSSASQTTIMVLNIVDPSVRYPNWSRCLKHRAWIAPRPRDRLITLVDVRYTCAHLSLFIPYYLYA
jgi:hypothetical protein